MAVVALDPRLNELVEQLSELDLQETTPNALEQLITNLQGDLEDISYELVEEKYEPYGY